MDCRLSVQDETELQYFLGQVDYSSPLIDDVRVMMGIQSSTVLHNNMLRHTGRRKVHRFLGFSVGAAAAIAVLIGIGASFMKQESDTVVVAYAQGHRLNAEQALKQSKADMEMVEDFIKRMTDIENCEQQKIEDFFNSQSL